jgi:hypothetical protein
VLYEVVREESELEPEMTIRLAQVEEEMDEVELKGKKTV